MDTRSVLTLAAVYRRLLGGFLALGLLAFGPGAILAQEQPSQALLTREPSLWSAGVGEGFNKGVNELSLSLGGGHGMEVLGSAHPHDWALAVVQYGRMLTDVKGKDQWYRGNWELVGEVFGGGQFHPTKAYVIGVAPLLRYNFAVGRRWVPFADLGAGLTATDIRGGDLSTTFEFNLQAGGGVRYFIKDNLAVSFQYRFMHLSNANLGVPNLGVNTSNFLLGLNWFF